LKSKDASNTVTKMLEKLSGDDVTKIIISLIAAGTICFVCRNKGSLELSLGDKKIILGRTDESNCLA
jgi:hypothetical protein